MIDLILAIRNLLRNRRRSVATLLALIVGTLAVLWFGGYRKNIEYSMITAYAREGGHLQVQHSDLFHYGSGDPTRYSIRGYQKLLDAIQRDPELAPMLTVVTPTLQLGGIASYFAEGVSRTVVGFGSVAQDRQRMRDWNEFQLPMPAEPHALVGKPLDAAIIGHGVARVLLLCEALALTDCPPRVVAASGTGTTADESSAQQDDLMPADLADLSGATAATSVPTGSGTRLELLASSAGGAPNVVSLQIVKAERQGFKELDEVYLALQLAMAQRLVYGAETPQATAIMVQLHKTADVEPARRRLEALAAQHLPGEPLAVLDFREINPFFVQTVRMFDTIFGFIFLLIGAIVLFTVGNTMSTAVVERTVEIGTVRAMGLRRRGVKRIFVIEGLLLGVAGATCGTVIAILGASAVNAAGLSWLPPGSGSRLPLLLIVWGEHHSLFGVFLGLVLIAGLSAWWPAHRASRLAITDALRHA
jgi:putative ABC transport system permease protein